MIRPVWLVRMCPGKPGEGLQFACVTGFFTLPLGPTDPGICREKCGQALARHAP